MPGCDWRRPRANERARDPPPRRQPAPAVRDDRAAGHAVAARAGLRICRVALRPRRHRLPRRGRGFLLLGAARVAPRAGRYPHHDAHHRDIPPRQACREPCAPLRRSAARHAARPHAQCAPTLCRMVGGAICSPGAGHRPQHRGADPGGAGAPATSGTGVSHLHRCVAAVSRPRRGAGGGDQPPCRRSRRADLRQCCLDPQTPARPIGATASRGRCAPAARKHPRLQLFPLRRTTVLNHPTLDRLRELGLAGMAKGFRDLAANPESRALEHAEWLGLLVDQEVTLRQQKRFEARTRTAKLRQAATVEDVDFLKPRGLDRTLFLHLASCDWVREHRHCLITGACGTGKSFIACALGDKACRENLSVLYQRSSRLFAALALARGDGRYARLMRQLARVNLLILDDWGPEPLTAEQRRDLLEIVEDRYNAGSLIITSQVPVDQWYEIVGCPTVADAILDRVVHNAHRIALTGKSRRKLEAVE